MAVCRDTVLFPPGSGSIWFVLFFQGLLKFMGIWKKHNSCIFQVFKGDTDFCRLTSDVVFLSFFILAEMGRTNLGAPLGLLQYHNLNPND